MRWRCCHGSKYFEATKASGPRWTVAPRRRKLDRACEVLFSECGQKPVSDKPVSQMDLDWRVGRLDLRALDLGRRLSS
jgi:hypothetical protein